MNEPRTVHAGRTAAGIPWCELVHGDVRAKLLVHGGGLHLHGHSPQDVNRYYTLPGIGLDDLRAMIAAVQRLQDADGPPDETRIDCP